MRQHCHRIVCSAVLLTVPVAGTGAAQPERAASHLAIDVGERTVVVAPQGAGRINLRVGVKGGGGEERVVALDTRLDKVTALFASPSAARVIVVGDAGGPMLASVVDLATGQAVFSEPVRALSIAPDKALLAYERFTSRGEPKASATYWIMAVDAANAAASPRRLLAPDPLTHQRRSDFVWVSDDVLAFLDLTEEGVHVVAAEVSRSGVVRRSARKLLDAERFVDVAQLRLGIRPSFALYEPAIVRNDAPGLDLRLTFPREPALRVRRVDVQLW